MSQENVELVDRAIDALGRGDWDGVLEHAAPEFQFDLSRATGPWRGVHGRDGSVWTGFFEDWESARVEPGEFIQAGEHVVVPLTFHGVGRDGIEVHARVIWTWTIRDGAIVRICMYHNRKEALEATGLRE
jgi:ketosteroid isomerase-like protein